MGLRPYSGRLEASPCSMQSVGFLVELSVVFDTTDNEPAREQHLVRSMQKPESFYNTHNQAAVEHGMKHLSKTNI